MSGSMYDKRLAGLNDVILLHGPHDSTDGGKMCAMEAVAWLAGEAWSDAPECASPIIAAFIRHWNDDISRDEIRTQLLRPLVPILIGTRTNKSDEYARVWMIVDWEMRTRVPAFLRMMALLEVHAIALESMPQIIDLKGLRAARRVVTAARDAAWAAAWNAANDAAGTAARDAARYAAWGAAWAAAGDAANDAAVAAAWDASQAAGGDAIRSRVGLAVAALQASAQDLVRRLCEVGR